MDRAHWNELPDDWSEDEKLAGDFLAGWPDEGGSSIISRHFKPGSDEEAAQAALVRVLRRIIPVLSKVERWNRLTPEERRNVGGLPPATTAIVSRFAGLLDATHPFDPRKFVLKNRPGAKRRIADDEIVAFFEKRYAEAHNVETAVADTADYFGVSTSTIWRGRRRHEARAKK